MYEKLLYSANSEVKWIIIKTSVSETYVQVRCDGIYYKKEKSIKIPDWKLGCLVSFNPNVNFTSVKILLDTPCQ